MADRRTLGAARGDRSGPPGFARRPASVVATLTALPIALLAGLLAFWWLGGFGGGATGPTASSAAPRPGATGPVALDARSLDPAAATACRALLAKLPGTLGALPRRPVTAGAEQNAAYGDPPITVACGAPAPSVAPTATVYPMSGVCWYPDERPDATVWTTLDRRVPVQVRVPRGYDPPGQWVIRFSAPVSAAIDTAATRPGGC